MSASFFDCFRNCIYKLMMSSRLSFELVEVHYELSR
jgi:hypothetical protein